MGAAQVPDQRPDLDHLGRVQAHGRLVQNDDLRAAHQGARQPHPLFVALGQVADKPSAHALQPGAGHGLFHLACALGTAHALQLCGKAQIFLHRHIRIERRLLRQIADAGPRLSRLLQHIVAVDGHGAAGGGNVPGEDVHRGGFARAVGAEQAVNHALLHEKAQVVHRQVAAIPLGEMLYFDQESTRSFFRRSSTHRRHFVEKFRTAGSKCKRLSPQRFHFFIIVRAICETHVTEL